MKIKTDVYHEIISCPGDNPPESGGILGARSDYIDVFEYDVGLPGGCACSYAPDTVRLNRVISEWQENDIAFAGIFHAHYFGVKTLSEDDIRYIHMIMNAMPPVIQSLYFPIVVMPQRELVVYRAERSNGNISVLTDTLLLCENYREECST